MYVYMYVQCKLCYKKLKVLLMLKFCLFGKINFAVFHFAADNSYHIRRKIYAFNLWITTKIENLFELAVSPSEDWYDDVDHKEHIATSDALLSSKIQLIQQRLETESKQVCVKEGVRVRQCKCSHTLTNQNQRRAAVKCSSISIQYLHVHQHAHLHSVCWLSLLQTTPTKRLDKATPPTIQYIIKATPTFRHRPVQYPSPYRQGSERCIYTDPWSGHGWASPRPCGAPHAWRGR